MCGIAGMLDFSGSMNKETIIRRMNECLSHRGPDDTGYFNDDLIAFGHKRLAVIDLSTSSNQPMSDYSGRYCIIFNGEI
jgi:asparagine synthase (glutamine-hydrolysing)